LSSGLRSGALPAPFTGPADCRPGLDFDFLEGKIDIGAHYGLLIKDRHRHGLWFAIGSMRLILEG